VTTALQKRKSIHCVTVTLFWIALVGGLAPGFFARDAFAVTGEVKADSGERVSRAVIIADNGMGITFTVFSDSNGRFIIKGLLPGSYEISAAQSGCVTPSKIIVIPAEKSLSLVLRREPGHQRPKSTNKIHE
jgi:hypothetical protein